MKLRTTLIYWKLYLFGDKELEKNGCKMIPCKKCDKPFKAYVHFGEVSYVVDNTCPDCTQKVI